MAISVRNDYNTRKRKEVKGSEKIDGPGYGDGVLGGFLRLLGCAERGEGKVCQMRSGVHDR